MLFPCIRLSVLNDAAFPSLNPCQHLISHNFQQTGYYWQLESDCMTPCRPSFFWILEFLSSHGWEYVPLSTPIQGCILLCADFFLDTRIPSSQQTALLFLSDFECVSCVRGLWENYIIHDSGNRFSEPWSIAKISKISTKSFDFPCSIDNRNNL